MNRVALNQALFPDPNAPAKPRVARHAELLPAPIAPYSSIVEDDCDECGGSGSAGRKNEDYEPCTYCVDGKVAVLRNWLVEAFQIADGVLDVELRREHIQALRAFGEPAPLDQRQVA
jgi:hypothetical protein